MILTKIRATKMYTFQRLDAHTHTIIDVHDEKLDALRCALGGMDAFSSDPKDVFGVYGLFDTFTMHTASVGHSARVIDRIRKHAAGGSHPGQATRLRTKMGISKEEYAMRIIPFVVLQHETLNRKVVSRVECTLIGYLNPKYNAVKSSTTIDEVVEDINAVREYIRMNGK